MTWDGSLRLQGLTLEELAGKHGGRVLSGGSSTPVRIAPIGRAGPGDLSPWLAARFAAEAREAAARGATLLVDASLESRTPTARGLWVHERAAWGLASVLEDVVVPEVQAVTGAGCTVGPGVFLGARVVVGARVTIGAGAVIGHPGFGWAFGDGGTVRAIPQRAGVIIEDDVAIGPLTTVDAGTLAPTRIRRGAKLDAHVHVGHNCDVGEDTILAAQCGLAGSVRIGRGVLVGGQVGIADHVVIGDGARIAAKSGVIGDVPPGGVVAGYPAVPRLRWLRALARLYRGLETARQPRGDERDGEG